MPPDHVCSFTPKVLRQLLHDAGFTSITITHQAMFEVLADRMVPWISSPSGWNVVRSTKKVVYYGAAMIYQRILNAIGSGDLVVVFARREG